MLKQLKKIKEKEGNNKGFTLVELIVVIVILGILAAILVPALLGYIDKAKNQQVVLNAKSVLTAAQADLSSAYAKREEPEDVAVADILATADVPKATAIKIKTGETYSASAVTHAMYTVYGVSYTENGSTIYYVYNATTGAASWDSTTAQATAYNNLTGKEIEVLKAKTSQ